MKGTQSTKRRGFQYAELAANQPGPLQDPVHNEIEATISPELLPHGGNSFPRPIKPNSDAPEQNVTEQAKTPETEIECSSHPSDEVQKTHTTVVQEMGNHSFQGAKTSRERPLPPEYKIHVSSVRSAKNVEDAWERLQEEHKDIFDGLVRTVEPIDLGPEKGIFYRIHAGPLTRSAAHAHCKAFAKRKNWCTVVKADGPVSTGHESNNSPGRDELKESRSGVAVTFQSVSLVDSYPSCLERSPKNSMAPAAGMTKEAMQVAKIEPGAGAAPSTPLSVIEPADDDLLILQLQINDLVLSEGLTAYRIPPGVCLYLSEVTEALDFPISVGPDQVRAEGWFLHEDRTFVLDLTRNEVFIANRAADFDANRIERHPNGICVEMTLLSSWFPVSFKPNLSNAFINLISWEPLPIEQRLAREKRRKGLRSGSTGDIEYPRVEIPYQTFRWPAVDTFVDYQLSRENYDAIQERRGRYNVLVIGDLLQMSGELFVSGDTEDTVSSARASLGRKDPAGGLLGLLDAEEFTLGDVATPETRLVATSRTGRGVSVSSFPLDQPDEFDRITLRGDLPTGWEVELYRTGILLDFQLSQEDGRYEFLDVPLLFGRNELRLVFYGPQGQIREETKEYFIGSDFVRPGEDYFQFAINQHERDLITVDDMVESSPQGDTRFVLKYERGIADGWSLGGAAFSLPFEDERRNYASLYLNASFLSFATQLDVAADIDGGGAGELSVQGYFGPLNLFARHGQFLDFISERVNQSVTDALENASEVRADVVIPAGAGFYLPVTVEASHGHRESGLHELNLGNRISTAYERLSVTNTLQFDGRYGGDEQDSEIASGTFLLNYDLGLVGIRGEMNYDAHPERSVSNLLLTTDWDIEEDISARFVASHDLREEITGVTAGLNMRMGDFDIGATLGASDDGAYFAGLSLAISFGRDPWSGSLRTVRSRAAGQGTVAARVYVDENRNSQFDDGDQLLPNVGFVANRSKSKDLTDDNGTVVIDNLPVYRDIAFSVSRGSLEDPYMVPALDDLRIATRPGAVAMVDFPLVRTGEVDGTVYLAKEDAIEGLGGIQLV